MRRKVLFFIMVVLSYPLFSQVDPNDFGAKQSEYIERAIDFNIANQNDMAIKELDKAILENPKFISAFVMRGDIKSQILDYKGALQDYNRAIEIDPSEAEPYKSRGNVKIKLQDYTGAIKDFTFSIERNANDPEGYNLRGLATAGAGNFEGALKDYNNALELNPKYAEALANKADVLIHLNRYMEAIKECNHALQFEEISIAFYFKGIAKVNLGDKMGGCMDLSKAGEMGYEEAYIAIKKYCQ